MHTKNSYILRAAILFIMIFFVFLYLMITYSFPPSFFKKTETVDILFRYDDYGIPNDQVSSHVFSAFKETDLPLLVSIIPFRCREKNGEKIIEPNFFKDFKLLADDNFMIGLHGFCHRKNDVFAGTSEFSGLSIKKQSEMIELGKQHLEIKLNKTVMAFIPPWNSYDGNTVQAVHSAGINIFSARRNDLPEIEKTNNIDKLDFLPYTITLNNFMDSLDLILNDKNYEGELIVVMMHPYDFIEHDKNRGKVTILEFGKLINKLKMDSTVNISTITDDRDFSYDRLDYNSYTFYQWIPKFLQQSSIYYLNTPTINTKKILSYTAPWVFFFFIYAVGFIISQKVIDTMSRNLNFRKGALFFVSLFFIIFFWVALIFFDGKLRPEYTIGIVLSFSFLSSFARKSQTQTRNFC